MSNTNFYQVIPDSHFWGSIDSFLYWLGYQLDGPASLATIEERQELLRYIQIGFNNAKKAGYNIYKNEPYKTPHECFWSNASYPRRCVICLKYEPAQSSNNIPPPPAPPSDRFIREGGEPPKPSSYKTQP